jgi:hypothetical protein
VKASFFLVEEGQPIEREVDCSRCGKPFTQGRVNPDRLNEISASDQEKDEHILDLFLTTCAVEVEDNRRKVWFPARCASCTRPDLRETPRNTTTSHLRRLK